jgi:hypothetical protein
MTKNESQELERLKQKLSRMERSKEVADKSLHIKSRMLEILAVDHGLGDDDMDAIRRQAIAECGY